MRRSLRSPADNLPAHAVIHQAETISLAVRPGRPVPMLGTHVQRLGFHRHGDGVCHDVRSKTGKVEKTDTNYHQRATATSRLAGGTE